ncbi:hypothetical protein HYV57_00040 [Candidatus Peregrinibacteria bacterium]|nr:hypothetical protein [Candidatus Peregrinibacteria bacterium]
MKSEHIFSSYHGLKNNSLPIFGNHKKSSANLRSCAYYFEKKYISLAGKSSSLGGRKFAKNAIGYAFFNAHFCLFLKAGLRNSL